MGSPGPHDAARRPLRPPERSGGAKAAEAPARRLRGINKMSFGKSNTKPAYTGLRVNSSVSFLPIPIVMGWARISPNLVWAADFKQVSGGGKGGAFGKNDDAQYTASFIGMLCEGPIRPLHDYLIWLNSVGTEAYSNGFWVFRGDQTAPWPDIEAEHADQALVYPGMCYLAALNVVLGDSNELPNVTMLVPGILSSTGPNAGRTIDMVDHADESDEQSSIMNVGDADPTLMAQAFLTGHDWSVPDFPAGAIDQASWFSSAQAQDPGEGDATWQSWCYANGISLSLMLDSVEQASDTLSRLFQLTVTAPVWSGDRLKAVPYGDSQVTANGSTYTPNLTPVYALEPDSLIIPKSDKGSAEPVQIDRADISSAQDLPNSLRLTWRDAANIFTDETIGVKDDGQIELYGEKVGTAIQASEITFAPVAQTVAQLLLQRALYIRNTYRFTLPPVFFALDPMDLVSLDYPDLGLDGVVVRITEIQSDDDGNLQVTAEEFPQGVATAVAYPVQVIVPQQINTNLAPDPVNPPIIIEPGPALTGGTPQIWVAVSGGSGGLADANWGGCDIHASLDGVDYQKIGTQTGPARMGVTTASLGAYGGGNPDTGDTLAVCLAESGATLGSVSATAAAQAQSLCYAGGEYLSYETAQLASGAQAVTQAAVVPAASPFTVEVEEVAGFVADLGVAAALGPVANAMYEAWPIDMGEVRDETPVSDGFGTLADAVVSTIDLGSIADPTGVPGAGNAVGSYTKVTGTPGPGQYAVAAGAYAFDQADAGSAVTIAYSFTAPVYALTGLWRGLYGSSPAAQASGVAFARLDGAIFKYTLPANFIGQPLWLKFASFNIYGNATQDLSVVEPYPYTPAGTGMLGPVIQAMASGIPIDLGSVAIAAAIADQFGQINDTIAYPVDLGLLAA